jgi:glucose-6-phosphate 1-epimerase
MSESVLLRSADGATAEVNLNGAHVTSWRPAPGTEERLFLSAISAFHDGVAIRGGIPVIFPQFAAEGPLPRHGFARTSRWTSVNVEEDSDGRAVAMFSLTDSPATRAIWPASFLATLSVRVGGAELCVTLSVENRGTDPFSFTAALHTYLRVADVLATTLVGLHGGRYRESGNPHDVQFDQHESLRIDAELDRVYINAPSRLVLREPERELMIEADAFPDVVVWNPGAERAADMKDMEPGGERRMLCVEAAAVQTPVLLNAGRRWIGSQTLTA